MSMVSQGPGWWLASDGFWYAPERHPDYVANDIDTRTPTAVGAHQGTGSAHAPHYSLYAPSPEPSTARQPPQGVVTVARHGVDDVYSLRTSETSESFQEPVGAVGTDDPDRPRWCRCHRLLTSLTRQLDRRRLTQHGHDTRHVRRSGRRLSACRHHHSIARADGHVRGRQRRPIGSAGHQLIGRDSDDGPRC
jgi:hypothetical protein